MKTAFFTFAEYVQKKQVILEAEMQNVQDIVQKFLESSIGEANRKNDCKTVTRAFVNWAKKMGFKQKFYYLLPLVPKP